MESQILPKLRLDELIALLRHDGFEVIGPRIDQGAIVYDTLQSVRDLPIGWTDRQAPGSYRLEKRTDNTYFGYAVGPHSWKKYLFPPTLRLWQAQRTQNGFAVNAGEPEPPRRALFGVRACELHAIAVQDRVFLDRQGCFTDPHYAQARSRLFLVAVECEHPAGTCFCASMNTGPQVNAEPSFPPRSPERKAPEGRLPLPLAAPASRAEQGPGAAAISFHDLVLTELDEAFIVRAGSEGGRSVLERLKLAAAPADRVAEAQERVARAARSMGRTLDVTDIRALLHGNQEHPRWSDVAGRCLSCTNCTLVCPTCFCSSVEDTTDLSLQVAERLRRWDSCFNPEFAGVHGGNYRPSIRGRYRQWLTHKFASWHDQFDVSGCVGCGRCITWCPVGIDVTEEIGAIRTTTKEAQP
jgi:formate hydrogenlyase subunit 6/NADH:ubiquinone oxidoreductase subunit I